MGKIYSITRALFGAAHGRAAGAQAGNAILEFIIALPFLTTLIFGAIDFGTFLNQYQFLTQAVQAGVREAESLSQLETGSYNRLTSGQNCNGVTSRAPASTAEYQATIQDKVNDLIGLHKIRVKSNTLCITSSLTKTPGAGEDAKNENTVYVKVSATFDGLTPFAKLFPLKVEARGPYQF